MLQEVSFDLQNFAKNLGWSLAGASDLQVSKELETRYRDWVRDYKGPQMQYLERRMEERLQPQKYFPSAKSILCFGLYYFPGWAKGEIKVSNYSWGPDYHLFLKEKLETTLQELQKTLGKFEHQICVDTSPVLEKYWAQKAGLGWQGKNTLLLNPGFGSLFFLAEVLCSLPPDRFEKLKPMTDHCGTCTRCIEACPTDALEPYRLIAERCISYLNLEHKGDFEKDTPSLEGWVAGCDICQEVCPWNSKLIPLETDPETRQFEKLSVADLQAPNWQQKISARAISYVKPKYWPRNLKQALRSKTS